MSNSKNCSKCGSAMPCTGDESCWCMEVPLSEKVLTRLKADFSDCLCADCLAKIQTADSKS